MAEEVTSTNVVKTASDGTVKITVEKYQELLAKAAEEKRPVYPTYTTVEKTPAMVAADNQMWGTIFMGGGASIFLVGLFQFVHGMRQAKSL